jgi:magnesium transporter
MFHKLRPAIGARPGTLAVDERAPKPALDVVVYGAEEHAARRLDPTDELPASQSPGSITWLDIRGLGDPDLLRRVADTYDIHSLTLEDLVHVPHRPVVEPRGKFQLFIVRALRQDESGELVVSQVSVLVGEGLVLTFQESADDLLGPVRQRLEEGMGPMRHVGADYLAYSIVDTVVDGYYPIVEALGARMDALEDDVLGSDDDTPLPLLNLMRRNLLQLRRAVWPLRDGLNALLRDGGKHFRDETRVYLKDTRDHCVQVADIAEMYKEFLNGLFDTHLAVSGNKANEIMKVLTMMASIFIPLSFLAAVYGMNFDHMPELHARWAYPVVLGVMLTTAVGLLLYYRKKGWLGRRRR